MVDQISDLLTAASVLKQGLQGEDSDLARDIVEEKEEEEEVSPDVKEGSLSADIACEVKLEGYGEDDETGPR
jgi:hypothetical protein